MKHTIYYFDSAGLKVEALREQKTAAGGKSILSAVAVLRRFLIFGSGTRAGDMSSWVVDMSPMGGRHVPHGWGVYFPQAERYQKTAAMQKNSVAMYLNPEKLFSKAYRRTICEGEAIHCITDLFNVLSSSKKRIRLSKKMFSLKN